MLTNPFQHELNLSVKCIWTCRRNNNRLVLVVYILHMFSVDEGARDIQYSRPPLHQDLSARIRWTEYFWESLIWSADEDIDVDCDEKSMSAVMAVRIDE